MVMTCLIGVTSTIKMISCFVVHFQFGHQEYEYFDLILSTL